MRLTLPTLGAVYLLLATAAHGFAQSGDIEIKDVWARATPGGAQTAAVYATIVSAADDRLTGAATPAAKEAQLHTMATDNGVMTMRQVDDINLPAGQPVTLKPGGYHIVPTGLTQPLVEGQTFPLTLTFAKTGNRQVTVSVQKIGAMGPGAGTDMPGMNMPGHR